jgi:regulator of protease activity HflC (stomatin/prohibitin superfamily)
LHFDSNPVRESGSVDLLQEMERSMSDQTNRQRIQRHREARRAQGLREATVWVDQSVTSEIDKAVERGLYPSRQAAMSAAIRMVFSGGAAKRVM